MKEKILILDDDIDILEILTLILTDSGYEILGLSDGEKIFEEIKNFEPNLILMDVMLGNMDGLSICKAIKEKSQYKDLPVILISATHDMNEFLDLQGSPNDYLEKPFDIDVLLSKVEKHLKFE
jgi:DNA-binding response OmpR family regulator